jgi:hypothetical protein
LFGRRWNKNTGTFNDFVNNFTFLPKDSDDLSVLEVFSKEGDGHRSIKDQKSSAG